MVVPVPRLPGAELLREEEARGVAVSRGGAEEGVELGRDAAVRQPQFGHVDQGHAPFVVEARPRAE